MAMQVPSTQQPLTHKITVMFLSTGIMSMVLLDPLGEEVSPPQYFHVM
jgi:hypothetical protein